MLDVCLVYLFLEFYGKSSEGTCFQWIGESFSQTKKPFVEINSYIFIHSYCIWNQPDTLII